MRRSILLLLTILFISDIHAQYKAIPNNFRPPLDIPMYLSGNFAELRADHFHSGIDIKTQGVIGKKVYAIGDGYVSRIKIQTNGYGHSLYITYPGGLTSVFGHLESYNDTIDRYVKAYQYRNHVFEVDIYPSPDDLPVKKGEIVARSGNTGSSGGPHLHFELRNTASQHTINALRYGLDIRDDIPPHLYSLFVYSMQGNENDRVSVSRREYAATGENGHYRLKSGNIIEANGSIGLGLECYDFLNGSPNRCGVYSIELFVNEEPVYQFQTDEFSFTESRYINSHMDYSLESLTRRRTHDLYRKPGEFLSMNKLYKNDGILTPGNDETQNVMIVVTDAYGNSSSLSFQVRGAGSDENKGEGDEKEIRDFKWYQSNYFSDPLIKMTIPKGALYQNTLFTYKKENSENEFYPYIHSVHSKEVPLQKYASLSIRTDSIPENLLNKTGIVLVPEKGLPEWEGGEVKNGWITAAVREFGNYTLLADTVPPIITPLNISQNKDMRSQGSVRFSIDDKLSGIASYEGYIDSNWVLFEYEPKNKLLFYIFDSERMTAGSSHELELYIRDYAGNTAVYHSTLNR